MEPEIPPQAQEPPDPSGGVEISHAAQETPVEAQAQVEAPEEEQEATQAPEHHHHPARSAQEMADAFDEETSPAPWLEQDPQVASAHLAAEEAHHHLPGHRSRRKEYETESETQLPEPVAPLVHQAKHKAPEEEAEQEAWDLSQASQVSTAMNCHPVLACPHRQPPKYHPDRLEWMAQEDHR